MRSRFARFAAVPVSAAAVLAGAVLIALWALPASAAEPPQHAAAAAPAATAAAPADAKAATEKKMQAQMEMYVKLAEPGDRHKQLAGMAGKWTTTGKTWMDPSQPAIDFKGTVEFTPLLGGRYVRSVHKGSFFGRPFEGQATDGYDNATHEYFSTWIDNYGTGVMVFKGTCDDPCKVLTETAEAFDPMMGKVVKSKEVYTFVDPDTYRFEMYMVGATPDGKDVKVMEMLGKRDK